MASHFNTPLDVFEMERSVIGAVVYHVKLMMAESSSVTGHHIDIWYHEIFNSLKLLWYQSASVSFAEARVKRQ
jgi:hypothetical protein